MLELEGEMISQGVRAVCHEPVAAIPVKEATLGGTNTNNLHVPGDLQPKRCPALLTGVAVLWHLWAEKAFPHTQHAAFPIGVFFLVNSHQVHLFLLGCHVEELALPTHVIQLLGEVLSTDEAASAELREAEAVHQTRNSRCLFKAAPTTPCVC